MLVHASRQHKLSDVHLWRLKCCFYANYSTIAQHAFCSLLKLGFWVGHIEKAVTTLQSMRNAKLIQQRFWHCYKAGSSIWFKRYQTTHMWVSSQLPFAVDQGLSWFIITLGKGKLTWHSKIGFGVLFESSWWARFHSSAKTYADWVWHSL